MLLRSAWFGVALLRSAPSQGVSRPPHVAGSDDCGCGLPGWSGVASLCARSRGEPSSAHCEQRLSDGSPLARANPCTPAPECGVTREKGQRWQTMQRRAKAPCISARAPTRSAASRDGMAGWAGEGGGRFGERREYEAPTLPSTPRQHGMARHHKSQERDSSSTARLATTTVSRETAARHGSPPHTAGEKQRSPNDRLNTLA